MLTPSVLWWLLAGAAVVVELITGTFYLLMIAIGLAAAALAAFAGASSVVQVLVAAFVGGGAVLGWHEVRRRQPARLHAAGNRDVNLDIGESVQVSAWKPDGTSTVQYRGAAWTVMLAAGSDAAPGTYRVVEVTGNRLVVARIPETT